MPVNQRIKNLLDSLNINQGDFAQNIGVTPQGISKTIKGDSKPSFDMLESIMRVYPDLNANWLLTGAGEMWLSKQNIQIRESFDRVDDPPVGYGRAKKEDQIAILIDDIARKNRQLENCEQELNRLKNGGSPVYGQ